MKKCALCKDVVDIVNDEGLCEDCLDYVDINGFYCDEEGAEE